MIRVLSGRAQPQKYDIIVLMDEYLDILDENGIKTGKTKLRRAVHRDGDWHRSVNVLLVTPRNEVLLQRRSPNKDSWPDKWDISCGGHVTADNDVLATVFRELKGELNFSFSPSDALFYIDTFKSSSRPQPDFHDNSFDDLFILFTNKTLEDLTFQEEEISALKFVPLEELRHMVQNNDSDLVPHHRKYEAFFKIMDRNPHF